MLDVAELKAGRPVFPQQQGLRRPECCRVPARHRPVGQPQGGGHAPCRVVASVTDCATRSRASAAASWAAVSVCSSRGGRSAGGGARLQATPRSTPEWLFSTPPACTPRPGPGLGGRFADSNRGRVWLLNRAAGADASLASRRRVRC